MRIFFVVLSVILPLLIPNSIFGSEEKSTDNVFEKEEQKENILNSEVKNNLFITEFYPNPEKDEKEWVEIYNNNDIEVTVNNWFIDDDINDGSKPQSVFFSISPKSYFVIYLDTSILNNTTKDSVSLLDENENPINTVFYTKTIKGYSIQKLSNNNWYLTKEITPGNSNLEYIEKNQDNIIHINTKSENSSDIEYLKEEYTNKLSKKEKENIFITEFMPAPDKENEWVELYNNNDHTVSLINWYIDDSIENGGTSEKFSLIINSKEYKIVKLTKSLLNNSNDQVSLLDENKFPLYIVKYKKTKKGYSIQRLKNNTWFLTKNITKEKENIEFIESVTDSEELDTIENEIVSENEETINLVKSKNEEKGEVLGSDIKKVTFTTISKYNEEPVYYSLPKGHVYLITEKNEPSSLEVIYKFFNKILW